MKISVSLPLLIAAALLLPACTTTSKSGDAYTRQQTRHEMTVRMGVIESLRPVTMEGAKSGVGGMAGAGVGAVAGSNIGGGKGQIVGAILGAVVGGLAGQAIEEDASKKTAVEITVQLDGGKLIAVVQEGDGHEFRAGDRVRVLSGSGETRVTR